MMKLVRATARHYMRDVYALYLATRDPRVPWLPKVITAIVVAYALSPIDLIPDFIPLLGQVDDLVLVPLGIAIAMRFIPSPIRAEHRAAAAGRFKELRRIWVGGLIVVVLWLTILALVAPFLIRHLRH